jgi:hypothetical protein
MTAEPLLTRQRRRNLSAGRRKAIAVASMVQWVLAAAAWIDLARRPADLVKGRKIAWAGIIAINFVGPIAYFRWGRR